MKKVGIYSSVLLVVVVLLTVFTNMWAREYTLTEVDGNHFYLDENGVPFDGYSYTFFNGQWSADYNDSYDVRELSINKHDSYFITGTKKVLDYYESHPLALQHYVKQFEPDYLTDLYREGKYMMLTDLEDQWYKPISESEDKIYWTTCYYLNEDKEITKAFTFSERFGLDGYREMAEAYGYSFEDLFIFTE